MGPKRFWRQNFSLFLVKLKKLGFNAPLTAKKIKVTNPTNIGKLYANQSH